MTEHFQNEKDWKKLCKTNEIVREKKTRCTLSLHIYFTMYIQVIFRIKDLDYVPITLDPLRYWGEIHHNGRGNQWWHKHFGVHDWKFGTRFQKDERRSRKRTWSFRSNYNSFGSALLVMEKPYYIARVYTWLTNRVYRTSHCTQLARGFIFTRRALENQFRLQFYE